MQLVCLNAWGGRAFDALAAFFQQHADSTDIFCLQEVFSADRPIEPPGEYPRIRVQELTTMLPGFVAHFAPLVRRVVSPNVRTPVAFDAPAEFGLAMLVRETVVVRERGHVSLGPNTGTLAEDGWVPVGMRPLQYARVAVGSRDVLVANVHGTAVPVDKLDSLERLEQSRLIARFLSEQAAAVILCGDFNLSPETVSIAQLESRLRNLVREYGIATTRSRLNPYWGTPREQKHADYTFVSAGIAVRSFSVPDVAVSDHLPMILSFE